MKMIFIIGALFIMSVAHAQNLNWCHLEKSPQSPKLKAAIKKSVQAGVAKLNTDFPVLKSLGLAGTLPTDPAQIASLKAVRLFPSLIDLAACARFGTPSQASACLEKLSNVTLSWARTYKPTGNSINEMRFIQFFQAVDLAAPKLPPDVKAELHSFIRSLVQAGDNLFSKMHGKDARLYNNWFTWRLAIRGLAGKIINDEKIIKSTHERFSLFILVNLFPDGRTEDYIERDALLYHVYNLEAYQTAYSFAPESIDHKRFRERYKEALNLMEPYYTGREKHMEFARSQVAFDIQRRNAGLSHYQNAAWDTSTADPLLKLARLSEPSLKPWTKNLLKQEFDPSIELFTAACGE